MQFTLVLTKAVKDFGTGERGRHGGILYQKALTRPSAARIATLSRERERDNWRNEFRPTGRLGFHELRFRGFRFGVGVVGRGLGAARRRLGEGEGELVFLHRDMDHAAADQRAEQ